MGWVNYLLALLIVIAGLSLTEQFAPQATGPLVLAILLGVAISRPTFSSELQALSRRIRGGS